MEQSEVLICMGLMTRGALALADRAVVVGVVREQFSHVRKNLSVGCLDWFVVAIQAQFGLGDLLKFGFFAEMGVVALGAAVGLGDGAVRDWGFSEHGGEIGVARIAEFRGGVLELESIVRSVRIVAQRAIFFGWIVNKGGVQLLRRSLSGVAVLAEVGRRFPQ